MQEATAWGVDWVVKPFIEYGFMREALLAGFLVVLSTSLVGVWVVLRGMSFLGDALAHGVLPGVAIAVILGYNTSLGAFIAAAVMVILVHSVRAVSPLPEDTTIGALYVGSLSAAVVVISSQSGAYFGDLNRFLFGSITGIDSGDIWRQLIVAAIITAMSVLFYRSFLALTFDDIQAKMLSLHPQLANMVFLILLAGAIVASFNVVGNLLVLAFLVGLPSTATMLVRSIPLAMVVSVCIGSLAVLGGLLLSYHMDTAASATIALLVVATFLVVSMMAPLLQIKR